MVTLLCFTLDDARYAVPVDRVLEVVSRVLLTLLPEAPPPVAGIFSYRGAPLPAIDLRVRFGHPPRPPERDDHFIIAESARRPVALVVDRVHGMERFSEKAVLPPPLPAHRISGVVPLRDGLLLIHDLDLALSLDEERTIDAGKARLARPE